jgi:hypothetical protein
MVLIGSGCATIPATEAAAVRIIQEKVRVGDRERKAMKTLQRAGFRCRQLAPDEYANFNPQTVKAVSCHLETDRTATGYRLVYVTIGVSAERQLTLVTPGSYPVVYRNLRRDSRGRIIVVPARP